MQIMLVIYLPKCISLLYWQWEKQTDFYCNKCSKWQILIAITTINGHCINRNYLQSQNKSTINRQMIVLVIINPLCFSHCRSIIFWQICCLKLYRIGHTYNLISSNSTIFTAIFVKLISTLINLQILHLHLP